MVVIKQPEKAIVSLVVIDSLPDENIHNKLDELKKISDLIFIFKGVDINPDKFTSLYQGCGYLDHEKESIVKTMKFAMEYCLEIFKSHATFLICPELELLKYKEIDFLALQNISISGLNLPIMIDRRLSSEEFKKIYSPKYGWFGNIIDNEYGKYSSYTNISPLIMLRPKMIKTILDLSEGILETFLNSTSHWIASIIERNGIEHINNDPWSNDIIQTERKK